MTRALLYCAGGGIGDSLVASVVARALRTRYARVDALTSPGHLATLERVPDLDDVLVDDGGDERILAEQLSARAYDCAVVTWATARTANVPALAKIPIRVGQARRLYSYQFTKQVVVRSENGDVTSHWSDILLDYARAIGCDTDDPRPRFVPTAADEAEAIALLRRCHPERSEWNERSRRAIILHPTNAIATKRDMWPVRGWATLARKLAQRFDARILISGSSADYSINEAIVQSPGRADDADADAPPIVNIAGKLDIGAFGALARHARAFVGITTGSMHVAAAAGAPTVGIFPFQSDFPERWAPLGEHTAVVRATYPCHAGDTKEQCRDYACIANLDMPRILAAAASLIGETHARYDTAVHL
jgi:ADP-heptose:LPS heptosyltransferase